MKNADMPASPLVIRNQVGPHGECLHNDFVGQGLTKREMFAMHAPSVIPEWFLSGFNADLSNIEKPEFSEHQINMMHEYNSENYGLSDDDFKLGGDAAKITNDYHRRCEIESSKQVYFAWKLCHADALLAELDK